METEVKETYTNFITPPDVIEPKENPIAITLIDAEWPDVEALAVWSQTSTVPFDVYLYHNLNQDLLWLDRVVGLSDYVLVNTDVNDFSAHKDRIAAIDKSWHYGEKTFLNNDRRVKNPIELFEQIARQLQQADSQKV